MATNSRDASSLGWSPVSSSVSCETNTLSGRSAAVGMVQAPVLREKPTGRAGALHHVPFDAVNRQSRGIEASFPAASLAAASTASATCCSTALPLPARATHWRKTSALIRLTSVRRMCWTAAGTVAPKPRTTFNAHSSRPAPSRPTPAGWPVACNMARFALRASVSKRLRRSASVVFGTVARSGVPALVSGPNTSSAAFRAERALPTWSASLMSVGRAAAVCRADSRRLLSRWLNRSQQ